MARLEESTRIVQLKVRLLGISPMIWRRVLVPAHPCRCESCMASCRQAWAGRAFISTTSTFTPCTTAPSSCLPKARTLPFPGSGSASQPFCLPLRHGRLLGARGPRREIPGPESEENLPRLHRWLRSLPARGLWRHRRIFGMAGGSDGLGCVVGPGPGHRICGRYPGGPQRRKADGRRPGDHPGRPVAHGSAPAVPANDVLPADRERGFSRRPPPADDAPATHVERRRGSVSRSAAKAPTTSPWSSDIRRTSSFPATPVTRSNLRRSMATLVSA